MTSIVLAAVAALATAGQGSAIPAMPETIHAFKMLNIDGKQLSLDQFKGKVLVVVNVASKCGLTTQYAGLEKLYREHKDLGLVVLGFPANEFGRQEPGTEAEIKEFCTTNFGVTFPMFSKIVVKGEGIHPLYTWLIDRSGRKDDIEWNFAKFVVGRDGKAVQRFHPRTAPNAPELLEAIQRELGRS
jgi:glutathione peroxidase